MKNRVNIILFAFILLYGNTLIAQQADKRKQIDSLRQLIGKSSIEDKVSIFDKISRQFQGKNNDSCFYYANLSYNAAQIDKSDLCYGIAYSSLGNAYADKFDYEKALEYYQKSKEFKEKTDNKKYLIESLTDLARTFRSLKRFSESIDSYRRAIDIAKNIEDFNNEGSLLYGLANAYFEFNDLNRALEYSIKAANSFLQNGIKVELGNTYNLIGFIHQSLRNNELAEEYYLKAYELYKQSNDIKGLSMALNNLGTIFSTNKKNQEAIEYYQKSLEYSKKLNDIEGIAISLNNIGMLQVELGQISKGIESYNQSLDYSIKLFNKANYANTFNNLGSAYIKSGDYPKAEQSVLKALSYSKEITDLAVIQESYQLLAQIFSKKGQFDKAFKYQGLQLAYNDSLYNKQNTSNILEMQARFESEAKEKEIQLLKKDNEIRILEIDRHKSFQNYLFITSILLLILLGVIFFSLRVKRKTYELLSQKNFELERANQKLTESEQNLIELNATKDKFFSIIAHDLKNPFNALLGFSELLEKNYDTYTSEEIKEYINVIYESSQSLFKLLDNLLQWSRTQTGSITYFPETFKLAPVVRQEVEHLQLNADKKKITVSIFVNEDLEAFADKNIISTVIRNLVNNALKFTNSNGHVEINAVENVSEIVVSVVDSGIGIDSSDIEKLFQLNSSLINKGTANEEGTGLGLILCKEFVEKNGGKIWVNSSKGKGSTFFFTLPKQPLEK